MGTAGLQAQFSVDTMLVKAEGIREFIVGIRRQIHRNPELGYRELETAKLIRDSLDKLAIPYQSGIAKTGIVGEMGKDPGPTVIIRADMDALPLQEETDLKYCSQVPGVMHACGHDAHTAMALGAAKLLKSEPFAGRVRFLFQPSEEDNYDDPDGLSGAMRMVADGVLQGASFAIAIHQIPTMPTGTISIRTGAVMGATDMFRITVSGRASHGGAAPQEGIDAVVITAELISLLQTIVSRDLAPTDAAVVSIGTIHGGVAPNIIADRVVLTGTTRALAEATRRKVHGRIRAICSGLAAMYNTEIEFTITHELPVTANDDRIANIARGAAERIFGAEGVVDAGPSMGGEDFSYIAREIPSCFALLGTRITSGRAYGLHNPKMALNEDALPYGAAYLAQTALDLLKS